MNPISKSLATTKALLALAGLVSLMTLLPGCNLRYDVDAVRLSPVTAEDAGGDTNTGLPSDGGAQDADVTGDAQSAGDAGDTGCAQDPESCTTCEVNCQDKCGLVPDSCGNLVACDQTNGGTVCPEGWSCTDFACTEAPCTPRAKEQACAEGVCGTVPDGCGGSWECGTAMCAADQLCQNNRCACAPPSAAQVCAEGLAEGQGARCGQQTLTDRCGARRSVSCGDCAEGQICSSGSCIPVPGPCDGLDLQTNTDHCGSCNNPCKSTETCTEGQCVPTGCAPGTQGPPPAVCDPFLGDDCGGQQACMAEGVLTGQFPDVQLEVAMSCQSPPGGATLAEGAACTGGVGEAPCELGLLCINRPLFSGLACARVCKRETNEGCTDEEVCVQSAEARFDHFGFCSPTCSPWQPNTCGAGQRCTANPYFPDLSCQANYLCLKNSRSEGTMEGSPCNRLSLNTSGCAVGLTCHPVGDPAQDTCVKPCQSDANCTGGRVCRNGAEPWQSLRLCTLPE